MTPSSEVRAKKGTRGCKKIALGVVFSLAILISPLMLLILCCGLTRFPPQIFGTNSDHFRAHVISPIPESVEILDVQFDDLMIHPDVAYYFRFLIDRSDLEKIIAYRSLKPIADDCSNLSAPEWWVSSSNDVEMYEYERSGEIILTLCYHAPSKIAYYRYWTY
jgi:hypothetical protein